MPNALRSGRSYAPDPAETLAVWAAAYFNPAPPAAAVLKTTSAGWAAEEVIPTLQWRLARVVSAMPTNWGAWLEVELRGHVLQPDPDTRDTWVRRVAEAAALTGEWLLESDGSPLVLAALETDTESDPLRVGQLRLRVRYGVLGPDPGVTPPVVAVEYQGVTGVSGG